MKDILLITNYWHFEEEKASSRYFTLANMIAKSGAKLEVVTSSFYHATKKQRTYENSFLNSFDFNIKLIYEKGYKKNISINRLYSHNQFAINVMKYLKKRKKPDLIYCVVPSLDVAYKVTKYAKKNSIRMIIDIQDLWPEAFLMAIDIPILSNYIFAPMKYLAKVIYANADEIVAVSDTYVEHALKVNKKCAKGHSVYLGIDLSSFDSYASFTEFRIDKKDDEILIAYVGALGHSYDLFSVFDAIKILNDRGINNLKFIIMGDGPLREKFETHAKMLSINVEFCGKLNYETMVRKLVICDIAVNPIVKNSSASIINKHADYLAAGLPIISTQESIEFRTLLTKFNAGINCENGNTIDLADKLQILIENKIMREAMMRNSRSLAVEKFNRLRTYKEIIDVIWND